MIAVQFNIDDLQNVFGGREDVVREVNAFLVRALTTIQAIWITEAQRQNVRDSGAYLAGIRGEGSVRIVDAARWQGTNIIEAIGEVIATAPHSSIIEDGHAAFHLPSKVDWTGPRVKVSKDGVRYLSIPFGHTAYQSAGEMERKGTTNATRRNMMPRDVYQQAKALERTIAEKVGPQHNAAGQFLQADRYAWGGRLTGMSRAGFLVGKDGKTTRNRQTDFTQVGRAAGKGGQALINGPWSASKFEGLIKSGPKGHTEYLTIRVMREDSPGWNIPAQAGKGIARRVSIAAPAVLQPQLEEAMRVAMGGE